MDDFKTVYMSAHNVNMLCMKNALINHQMEMRKEKIKGMQKNKKMMVKTNDDFVKRYLNFEFKNLKFKFKI